MNGNEALQKAKSVLGRNGIETFLSLDENEKKIAVEINWGDWKHDHLSCDYVMKSNGFYHLGNETTDEDGSDCYSAIHYFSYAA